MECSGELGAQDLTTDLARDATGQPLVRDGRVLPVLRRELTKHCRTHALIVPLWDSKGRLANVQMRRTRSDGLWYAPSANATEEQRDRIRQDLQRLRQWDYETRCLPLPCSDEDGHRQIGCVEPTGVAFANQAARRMLRGETNPPTVILGEGLTDHLSMVAGLEWVRELSCGIEDVPPVLSFPGVGHVASFIGPWCSGKNLLLGFDQDDAGLRACESVFRSSRSHGVRCARLKWEAGNDLNDLLQGLGGPEQLGELLMARVREETRRGERVS